MLYNYMHVLFQYDAALTKFDLLVMPTLPQTPCKLPEKDTPLIGNSKEKPKNIKEYAIHFGVTVLQQNLVLAKQVRSIFLGKIIY